MKGRLNLGKISYTVILLLCFSFSSYSADNDSGNSINNLQNTGGAVWKLKTFYPGAYNYMRMLSFLGKVPTPKSVNNIASEANTGKGPYLQSSKQDTFNSFLDYFYVNNISECSKFFRARHYMESKFESIDSIVDKINKGIYHTRLSEGDIMNPGDSLYSLDGVFELHWNKSTLQLTLYKRFKRDGADIPYIIWQSSILPMIDCCLPNAKKIITEAELEFSSFKYFFDQDLFADYSGIFKMYMHKGNLIIDTMVSSDALKSESLLKKAILPKNFSFPLVSCHLYTNNFGTHNVYASTYESNYDDDYSSHLEVDPMGACLCYEHNGGNVVYARLNDPSFYFGNSKCDQDHLIGWASVRNEISNKQYSVIDNPNDFIFNVQTAGGIFLIQSPGPTMYGISYSSVKDQDYVSFKDIVYAPASLSEVPPTPNALSFITPIPKALSQDSIDLITDNSDNSAKFEDSDEKGLDSLFKQKDDSVYSLSGAIISGSVAALYFQNGYRFKLTNSSQKQLSSGLQNNLSELPGLDSSLTDVCDYAASDMIRTINDNCNHTYNYFEKNVYLAPYKYVNNFIKSSDSKPQYLISSAIVEGIPQLITFTIGITTDKDNNKRLIFTEKSRISLGTLSDNYLSAVITKVNEGQL